MFFFKYIFSLNYPGTFIFNSEVHSEPTIHSTKSLIVLEVVLIDEVRLKEFLNIVDTNWQLIPQR